MDKEFAFDISLNAVVRVKAATAAKARAALPLVLECMDLSEFAIDGINSGIGAIKITEASLSSEEPSLFEVDGKAFDLDEQGEPKVFHCERCLAEHTDSYAVFCPDCCSALESEICGDEPCSCPDGVARRYTMPDGTVMCAACDGVIGDDDA